jgi:hypothetical protein
MCPATEDEVHVGALERDEASERTPTLLTGEQSYRRNCRLMSSEPEMEGSTYGSRAYACSLADGADIVAMPSAGGFLIARSIEPQLKDLSSAYPMFACRDWTHLRADIDALAEPFVSATIVTDPFADIELESLVSAFDVVRPLHQHFVIDLNEWSPARISRHHRRKLRTCASSADYCIRIAPPDETFLETWLSLYQTLIERKRIRDMRAFSRSIFARQIMLPGSIVASAWVDGELLGADWYFMDSRNVYAHLSAYSEAGYQRAISYPLMEAAIRYFQPLSTHLTLGGAPAGQEHGGLAHFKAGWSSRTLPTYICGVVLREDEFLRLNDGIAPTSEGYFPRYRQGEFARGDRD